MEIVRTLAGRQGNIKLTEEELYLEANKWEISHGGMSGRTAQQFVNYLAGLAE
jgi:predicted AAA+ superfamily ATPase